MADDQKPWEKYSGTSDSPPWEKYGGTTSTVPGTERLGGAPPAASVAPIPAGLRPESQPDPWHHPTEGLIGQGIRQIGGGIEHMAEPGRAAKFSGASDIIRGAGRAMLPAAIPAAVASPIAALGAAGAGYLGNEAGRGIARISGGGPEAQDLAGDVASIPASILGGRAGGLVSAGARPLAKSALGIPGRTEAYGADPGKAILEETRGIRPISVENSARQKLGELNSELESRAASSNKTGSLQPARDVIQGSMANGAAANSETTPSQLQPMLSQLQEVRPGFRGATEYPMGAHTPVNITHAPSPIMGPDGQPIMLPKVSYGQQPSPQVATQQPASNLLQMKRQFDQDFIKNWNPAASTKGQLGVARQGYRALGDELENAIPGAAQLNQRISSLIPVAQRARLTDLQAGPIEKTLDRATRPTGGLFPLLFGLHEGGPLGAAGVMAGQEMLGSPAARLIGARTLHAVGKPLNALPSTVVGNQR